MGTISLSLSSLKHNMLFHNVLMQTLRSHQTLMRLMFT